MIRSCALAAIAGIALFSSISFVHAEPLPTETFKILPAALAVEAAQAAIASCKAQGYTISVAIVDRAGNLKLLLVGDGAGALTPSLGRRCVFGEHPDDLSALVATNGFILDHATS